MPKISMIEDVDAYERLSRGDLSLTKLKLTSADEYEHFDAYLRLLPGNTTIQHVVLAGRFLNHLSPTEFDRIMNTIRQMQGVVELEIWNGEVDLSRICEALKECHGLRKLGLAFVGLRNLSSCSGLRHHPTLQRIYVSEFRFVHELEEDQELSQQERRRLRQQLQQQQQQEEDEPQNPVADTNSAVDPHVVTTTTTTTTAITPTGNEPTVPVGENNMNSLFEALATCPALEVVEFFSSRVQGDPWSPEKLARLIESDSMHTLILRRLGLGAAHMVALSQALKEHRTSPLRSLDLSENGMGNDSSAAILRGCAHHDNLRILNLRDNEIQQMNPDILTEAFQRSSSGLEKVNLTGNRLGYTGALALANVLKGPCTIKHLELVRTNLSDPGCQALAEALQENTSLQSISLAYNKITTATYVAFAQALQINRSLKVINLRASRLAVGIHGLRAIETMLVENFVVEEISFVPSTDDDPENEETHRKTMIKCYLHLNRAGRKGLLSQGYPSKENWVEALAKVNDDVDAMNYLIRACPLLCRYS